jgi:uncharacterized membrane protein YphA (DoxX/SURF4 family)
LARIGLAAVWLTSGTIKAVHSNDTYLAVQAYQLFPSGVVSALAAALPFVELALGVLLLAGLATRLVAAVSGLVLLAFIAGVAQAWARGLAIDCGCFGGGGQVAAGQTQYPLEILRDLGFMLLAVWLLIRPATWLSLDGALHGRPVLDALVEDEERALAEADTGDAADPGDAADTRGAVDTGGQVAPAEARSDAGAKM